MSQKAFIILKPKMSLTLVNFWKLKCDCFVIEVFLVHNIGMTIWEVLFKFFILLSMVKKKSYIHICSWEGCKNVKHSKLFLPLDFSCLCKIVSHLTSQFTSFMTLLSKTNLPMYNYLMSGANRCDEKQSQSRLASRFQVFHLLWNISFGGSCTSCHSPYVHKPPSYVILHLFSRMRFLDSVLILIQLLFF